MHRNMWCMLEIKPEDDQICEDVCKIREKTKMEKMKKVVVELIMRVIPYDSDLLKYG